MRRTLWLGGLLLAGLVTATTAQEAAPPPLIPAPPEPAGMQSIFNGQDLTGWTGDPRLWSVKDGALRGETTKEQPTKGNTFLIWQGNADGATVGDFELRLSVRLHHGNSGVQYRSSQVAKGANAWIVGGYQMEVANEPGRAGFIYHERGRGRICLVGEKVVMDEAGKKQIVGSVGDPKAIAATYRKAPSETDVPWNEYVIIARGNHVQQWINGVQTADLTDNDPKGRLLEGIIALQIHAGNPMWVEFKDLRLKRLVD